MTIKLLLDSLQLADGGRVECRISAPDGRVVRGVIERQFFEDFMGVPEPRIPVEQMGRIIKDNVSYFEGEAERQWQLGSRDELVIR